MGHQIKGMASNPAAGALADRMLKRADECRRLRDAVDQDMAEADRLIAKAGDVRGVYFARSQLFSVRATLEDACELTEQAAKEIAQ